MNLLDLPKVGVKLSVRLALAPWSIARRVLPGGSSGGESPAERRQREAAERRAEADATAQQRQEAAKKQRAARERRAAEVERSRTEAARQDQAERAKAISEEAPKGRLEVLDAVEDAQEERAEALTARDEAERLAGAAARAKAARKS